MARKPFIDKHGMKKGAWSPEEDDKLKTYIQKYGHWNWRELPKFAGLSRCGKSCRLRWMNYLRPNLKRGNYSAEEEDTIIKLREQYGNKWSAIAAKLPGRTDNEIKNYWHTHLKRRVKEQTQPIYDVGEQSHEISAQYESEQTEPSNNRSQREANEIGEISPRVDVSLTLALGRF